LIVDGQKKRRTRKNAAKGEDSSEEDNHKELLEWVDYYKMKREITLSKARLAFCKN
jgi:hypothetical protein